VSRTQITTHNVTHLCHEIRDIRRGQINIGLPEELSKLSSNTPDPSDTCGRDAPDYVGSVYNILCPDLPTDSHDSPARRDSSPPRDPAPPSQTPPGLLRLRTPSPVIGTSIAIPYATVVPSSGEWPTGVENKARNSPSDNGGEGNDGREDWERSEGRDSWESRPTPVSEKN